MTTYHVYLPPDARPHRDVDGAMPESWEKARFLAGGVSVLALVLPLVFLLWHRLWFWLAIYLGFNLAVVLAGEAELRALTLAVGFLPGVLLFLEGRHLIREKHEAGGWQWVDTVEAASPEAAEARFFLGGVAQETPIDVAKPPPLPDKVRHRPHHPADEPAFGFFAR